MTFHEMVQKAISQAGGVNKATRALGFYSANSISQWRDGRYFPELEDEERLEKLAVLAGVSLPEVLEAVRIARRERMLEKRLPNRPFPPRKPLHAAAHRLVRSRVGVA